MDERIFRFEPMGLREELLTIPLEERLIYDPSENLFFVNFEGYSIKTRQDIQETKETVEKILAPLGKKVHTIVNYDNFNINGEIPRQQILFRSHPIYHQYFPPYETWGCPSKEGCQTSHLRKQ